MSPRNVPASSRQNAPLLEQAKQLPQLGALRRSEQPDGSLGGGRNAELSRGDRKQEVVVAGLCGERWMECVARGDECRALCIREGLRRRHRGHGCLQLAVSDRSATGDTRIRRCHGEERGTTRLRPRVEPRHRDGTRRLARPLDRRRRSRFSHGRDRRRAIRAARRGVARHVRVLHVAHGDLQTTDRGARLLVHRRRRRLAGLLSRESVREGHAELRSDAPRRCCTPSSAGRRGCGRIARSWSWSSGCTRTIDALPTDGRSGSTGSTCTRSGTRCTR